ncbi:MULTISPECIES: insulinase family protein, partial [Butyricimonas]|uniref:insulinase family protein n=1 Tax=Butyricimonas TaxID=574697 RepID=UPI0007FB3FD1
MVKRFFIVCMLFVLASTRLFAQYDMAAPLPQDSNVRVGKLPNGMTYYIRHNKEPMGRASFYIIQNVGAILEEDNQNGLAHFLEHMAFNGTKHFPGRKGITNMLEKYGVQFGRNVNAYTAQDETVYLINDVPTINPGLLDTCLLVLHDWSHYLTLVDEEIDGERGVISEEWRTRRNADSRVRAKTMPVLLNNSKYARRDVIGDLNVIKNFDYQTLRDYYHKWYRPDLQAIAIAGDFDVDEMERKVKDLFSQIPAVENPAPREVCVVEPHDDVKFVCATDNELTKSSVAVFIKKPALTREQKNTHQYLKDGLVMMLYNTMLEQRIKESVQAGTADYIEGKIMLGAKIVRGVDAFVLNVTPKLNEEAKGLEALWRESERARRYGFTPTELERGKGNTMMFLDFFKQQQEKTPSESYIREMQQHFLNGEPMLNMDYQYNFIKTIIETVTNEDLIEIANRYITPGNMVIAVQGPESDNHITQEEAVAVIEKVNNSEIEPYVDEVVDVPLLDEELEGSKIVKTKKLPQFDAEEWTLENGVKVVFRKADYQKDEVSVTSYSKGGTSLYDLDKLPSAKMVNSFVKYFGLGNHDANTLAKILSGKRTSAAASVGEFSESVSGSTSPEHFETLMQLIYMRFEKPRFDKVAFDAAMERNRSAIANIDNNPKNAMMDSIQLNLNNYHPRVMPYSLTFLDKVNFEDIEAVYRDRIKDISDFTFFIVGNIDADTVKPLVEK